MNAIAKQRVPMRTAAVTALVRARLAQGPCTVATLMQVLVAYEAEHNVYLADGATALMAVLHVLAGLGEVDCARATGRKNAGMLVWLPAQDKPALVRREAAKKLARLQRKKDEKPPRVLTLVEAAPGGHAGDEAPGPMEVLARLAGCTTYKEPGLIRSSRPGLTTEEIDFVLHGVADPLARDMAFSIACQNRRAWRNVLALGYPRLLAKLGESRLHRDMVAGEKRVRVQWLLHDVFHDLASNRRCRKKDAAAKAVGMRLQTYLSLYRFVEHELYGLAHDAAMDAIADLFGYGAWKDRMLEHVSQLPHSIRI